MSKFLSCILTISLLAVPPVFADAQTAAYAEIAAVDAQDFPQISALVYVYNANGEFMTGLKPSDFTVYEDGQQRDTEKVTESTVPVQIVVAINP